MKKNQWGWKLLLILGVTPFLFAFGFCFVTSLLDFGGPGFHKTSFWDYLIMWSFLYWPAGAEAHSSAARPWLSDLRGHPGSVCADNQYL